MKSFARIVLSLAVLAASVEAARAQALDRVKLVGDVQVRGSVAAMSKVEVVVRQSASRQRKIPVNEIIGIVFSDEPVGLSQARVHVANEQFEDARQALDAIVPTSVDRDYARQEIQFYKALCDARLALAGNGEMRAAGKQMLAFAEAHASNYHALEAALTLGDLLSAMGNVDAAATWYGKLAEAPWPEYKIRSAVLAGRAYQMEGRFSDALGRYDQALAIPATTPTAKAQTTEAKLDRAVCLAETGDVDQGVRIINELLGRASPDKAALHAKAYNALGYCQKKAGKNKEALFAYLHVDVLYNAFPEAHAEALANLAVLWAAIGEPGRAREAETLLRERYPNHRRTP